MQNDERYMKRKNIEISKAYQIFFEILQLDDIDSLVLAAHDLFNLPIVLTDENYRVVSQHPKQKIGVSVWDTLLEKKVLENEIIESYQKTYLDDKKRFYEPFYENSGLVEECPRIFGEVYDNNKVYGHIAIFMFDNELSDTDLACTSIFIDALKLLMTPRKNRKNISYVNYFLDLLNKNSEPQVKRLAERSLSTRIAGNYAIMVIALGTSASSRALIEMEAERIPSTYRYTIGTVYNDSLVILFGLMHQKNEFTAKEKNFFSQVIDNLKIEDAKIGISQPFNSLNDASDYYIQALSTANISNHSIGYYNDLYPQQLFDIIKNNCNARLFVVKTLYQIEEYDKFNNTNYFLTLKNYCYNMCDNNKCSKELSIHRNTLSYRLGKINELFDLDLNNKKVLLSLIDSFQLLDII